MTKDEALKLALEALEEIIDAIYVHSAQEADAVCEANKAIAAIKQALALDKKAENARELGLDYEPMQDHYKEVVDDVRALFSAKRNKERT
jgi:ACT domain-containing protein